MQSLKERLVDEARKRIVDDDPSHDFSHALRVLSNAEHLASKEGGDMEVIIPAALFHDLVVYPKSDSRSKTEADESAEAAREILSSLPYYNQSKIPKVIQAIAQHSYSKGVRPESLEAQIIQDADRLEATGAISIMRTFSSTGQWKRRFYNTEDPFCSNRDPDCHTYGLDLFYQRLLKVGDIMNTKTARKLAKSRTSFLKAFLEQLKEEL